MEEKKKFSYSTLFLIICIIIIAVMGVMIYSLYEDKQVSSNAIEELNDKISNLENTIAQTQTNSSNNTEVKDELEILNIEDDLVKKLYGYILQSDDFDHSFAWQNSVEPTSFYKKDKTTYSSLSDMEKTLVVLKNYSSDEIKSVNKSMLTNIIDTTHIHDNVRVYENINEKSAEIFNQSNAKWNNYTGCAGALEYQNDNYYLSEFDGGGKGTSEVGYAKMQKAEKEEEYIYIYDKYIYIDSTNYDIGYNDSKVHIYTTSDKTNDIGTENERIWSSDTAIDNIYQKYENQLKTFKHTFKKSENGSYYWLSSEICD